MTPIPDHHRVAPTVHASAGRVNALIRVAIVAFWLSGCVSPYVGCVVPGSTYEPNGPPAAWVQRNVPISPAPVEYSQRVDATQPMFDTTGAPVMQLGAPTEASPVPMQVPAPADWQPTPFVPPAPQAQVLPPQAPPAETSSAPVCAPPNPEAARMQSMIDQLSAQIAALDRRTQEQARALEAAQQDTAAARQLTQKLEGEFSSWRTELNLVRQAIQEQSNADLQALDELNSVLEQLVPEPMPPESDPVLHDQSHMATGQLPGVRR